MDFLEKLGITSNIINKIYQNNDKVFIFNFICNKDEVVKNIKYLNNIGINRINDMLIYKLDFLVNNHELLKKKFNNYDINNIVKLINEDINAINLL